MSRLLVLLWTLLFSWAFAQETPEPAASATPSSTPAVTATASPTTPALIPLADIASRLESDREVVGQMRPELGAPEYSSDLEETLRALESSPDPPLTSRTADKLRQLQAEWTQQQSRLAEASTKLETRTNRLEEQIRQLEQLADQWQATLAQPIPLPAELKSAILDFLRELQTVRKQAIAARSDVLVWLTRISRQQSRVKELLENLSQAREQQVQEALRSHRDPLWQVNLADAFSPRGWQQLRDSWLRQLNELGDYFSDNGERFLVHLAILLLLAMFVRWMARKVEPWVHHEPALQRSAAMFRAPFLTALLATVLFSRTIYPAAPAAWRVVLGALAILPAGLLLRRSVDARLRPLVNLLLVLFLADQLRVLTVSQSVLSRVLFNAEVLGTVGFLVVFTPTLRDFPWVHRLCQAAAAVLAAAVLFSDLGFLDLGYLIGDAILRGAYLAVFLYAFVQICEGLFMVALQVPPLGLLRSVTEYRPRWRSFFQKLLLLVSAWIWLLAFLDQLGVRAVSARILGGVLTAGLDVGAVHLTLGGLIWFGVSVWAGYHASRLVRFALEEDVYPRTTLDRGLTYTLSTLVHYLILLLALFIGLASLGIDTTKFVVVFGALGVGIGLGLQNAVNNFVSGLILLFERPVRVGDFVDIGGKMGTLQSVGLRSTIVRTLDGADLIVPNGEMLSSTVLNWTSTGQRRRIPLDVGVAYGTSPDRLTEILLEIARAHPDISQEKNPPDVFFLKFGESSLDFQLVVWVENFPRWPYVRSELMTRIYKRLEEENIEIPFPHRTLQLVSVPPEWSEGPGRAAPPAENSEASPPENSEGGGSQGGGSQGGGSREGGSPS